jgi:hypothetical protein
MIQRSVSGAWSGTFFDKGASPDLDVPSLDVSMLAHLETARLQIRTMLKGDFRSRHGPRLAV